ncbi:MAG: ribonuclease J, partial [Firmicutes bacterium]|nr:ribonuclease J [Bacillota bacterium]
MAYNTTNTKRTAVKPRRTTRAAAQPKPKLKVIPLGGLHEIGKNITAFEYEDEIMIIDCGVAFPEDDMPGIDLVIPDFSYLVENKDKILGVVLTHGHEDHIGSLPYFFREINVPVYGTRLTIGLVETKLREHGLMEQVERINVNAGDTITLGKNFKVEFIRSTHSIADSVAIALTTPAGVVVHSGDFKVDYTPIQGEMIDLQRFAELGKKGVLLFMCESTNVELKGYTMSESNVGS